MSDIFEGDEEETVEMEEFETASELEIVEDDIISDSVLDVDARRRLEMRLEEKRLKDELDDFVDY